MFSLEALKLFSALHVDQAHTFLDRFRSPVHPFHNPYTSSVELEFKHSENRAGLRSTRYLRNLGLHETIKDSLGGLDAQSYIRIGTQNTSALRDMRRLLAYFNDHNQVWYITADAHIGTPKKSQEHFVLGCNLQAEPEHQFACNDEWRNLLPELFTPEYGVSIPVRH